MSAAALPGARPAGRGRRPSRFGAVLARRAKISVGTAMLVLMAAFVVVPLYWLVVASSKDNGQLFNTATFLPPAHLHWAQNFHTLVTFGGGNFPWWFLNSFIYAGVTATFATLVSTLAGYGLAKYRFRLRGPILGVVVGSLMVPATALVVPLFLMEHAMHLTNSYEGVILPLLVYPFGVYFMWIFAQDAVPDVLLDATRMDGAGELRAFFSVARPVLMPGMVTLFLLSFIATWNNYFLPLVILGSEKLFPLTVGLSAWSSELQSPGAGQPLFPEVILGSVVSVLPMLLLFPFLQGYVQRGLTFGAVAGD